jgi:small GTP-binding protein
MSKSGKKLRFKIIVIGDGRVGKTSLITKFTKCSFDTNYVETIGAQVSKYDQQLNDDHVRLIFWDIAGQRDLDFLRPSFYRESDAAIVVYSLENNEVGLNSFNHIEKWKDEIEKYCGAIPVVLFANKVDLTDENTLDQSKINEAKYKFNFIGLFFTSAKTGKRVHEGFNDIINRLYYKAVQ